MVDVGRGDESSVRGTRCGLQRQIFWGHLASVRRVGNASIYMTGVTNGVCLVLFGFLLVFFWMGANSKRRGNALRYVLVKEVAHQENDKLLMALICLGTVLILSGTLYWS